LRCTPNLEVQHDASLLSGQIQYCASLLHQLASYQRYAMATRDPGDLAFDPPGHGADRRPAATDLDALIASLRGLYRGPAIDQRHVTRRRARGGRGPRLLGPPAHRAGNGALDLECTRGPRGRLQERARGSLRSAPRVPAHSRRDPLVSNDQAFDEFPVTLFW
jgi:hypothetical protein